MASACMALGWIWYGCSYSKLLLMIEHGGIPCIEVLIAGESHVAPTVFGRPSDADLSRWHPAYMRLF